MADQNDPKKDPLLGNKISAAVLTALFIFVGLWQAPTVAGILFGGGHHGGDHHGELELSYCCVDLDAARTGGGGAEKEKVDLATLLASANEAAGKRTGALCSSCHTFEEGGANGTGPNLWNVIGRDVASVPGFNYSAALKEFGGQWTYERMDQYLANSQAYVPGTSMVQRFPQDDKRANLLAWLRGLSDDPVPFPEPAPASEETPGEDVAAETDAEE